jgi:hypothetical protein
MGPSALADRSYFLMAKFDGFTKSSPKPLAIWASSISVRQMWIGQFCLGHVLTPQWRKRQQHMTVIKLVMNLAVLSSKD